MITKNPTQLRLLLGPCLARVLLLVVSAVMALPVCAVPVPLATTLKLTLAWSPVPESNIQGYRLYVGNASNQYTRTYEVGSSLSFPVDGLVSGQTYYFAVKAIGNTGLIGASSDELIVPVSSTPNAAIDNFTANSNEVLSIASPGVLANDSDMDSSKLYAVLLSSPANGAVALGLDGGFVYTPRPGFGGTDSFVYRVTDGVYVSSPAIVEINVKHPTVELLTNGSFESDYTGWTPTGSQGVRMSAPYSAASGARLIAFNGGNLPNDGVLAQSFATTPGRTYTLSFATGVLAYNYDPQMLSVNVVGMVNLLSQTITTVGNGTGKMQWTTYTRTFVADSALTTLRFKDDSMSTGSIDLLLDSVSVTTGNIPPQIPALVETASTPSLSGTPGYVSVGMTVVSAGLYVLERSEDLVTWIAVGSSQVTQPGRVSFVDAKPAGSATKVFYRIGFQ